MIGQQINRERLQQIADAATPVERNGLAPSSSFVGLAGDDGASTPTHTRGDIMRLINPLYLNTDMLDTYIAAIEDGLRETETSTTQKISGLEGSLKLAGSGGKGSKGSTSESTTSSRDHAAARLQRLLSAMDSDEENLGVETVLQPDVAFPAVGTGSIVKWECDLFTPEMVSKLADAAKAFEAFRSIAPAAESLGLSMEGLPEVDQVDAMEKMIGVMDAPNLVVGDEDGTDWKIAGPVQDQYLTGGAELADRAQVIAKVTRVVPKGKWYPLVEPKGFRMSREERREKERRGPANEQDRANYLEGPLALVDFLAIYR